MANADESPETFAREATAAMPLVQKDVDALAPLLTTLRYADERGDAPRTARGIGETQLRRNSISALLTLTPSPPGWFMCPSRPQHPGRLPTAARVG